LRSVHRPGRSIGIATGIDGRADPRPGHALGSGTAPSCGSGGRVAPSSMAGHGDTLQPLIYQRFSRPDPQRRGGMIAHRSPDAKTR